MRKTLDGFKQQIQNLIDAANQNPFLDVPEINAENPSQVCPQWQFSVLKLNLISQEIRRIAWTNRQLANSISQMADQAAFEINKKHNGSSFRQLPKYESAYQSGIWSPAIR